MHFFIVSLHVFLILLNIKKMLIDRLCDSVLNVMLLMFLLCKFSVFFDIVYFKTQVFILFSIT